MDDHCMERNEAVRNEQRCATCGEPINVESWHPVLAEPDRNGTVHLYPFCTPDCRNEWNRDRTKR